MEKKLKILILTFLLLTACKNEKYPKKIELNIIDKNKTIIVNDKSLIRKLFDLIHEGEKSPAKFSVKIWIGTPELGPRAFGISKNRYKTESGQFVLDNDLEQIIRNNYK